MWLFSGFLFPFSNPIELNLAFYAFGGGKMKYKSNSRIDSIKNKLCMKCWWTSKTYILKEIIGSWWHIHRWLAGNVGEHFWNISLGNDVPFPFNICSIGHLQEYLSVCRLVSLIPCSWAGISYLSSFNGYSRAKFYANIYANTQYHIFTWLHSFQLLVHILIRAYTSSLHSHINLVIAHIGAKHRGQTNKQTS